MAIQQYEQQYSQQEQEQNHPSFLLDALYCEEERWEEEEDENDVGEVFQEERSRRCDNDRNPSLFPLLLLEQDLFWEDEELLSIFSKEKQQQSAYLNPNIEETDESLQVARLEAVEWMLKVNARYGFSTLTVVLSINYLDRFLSSFHFQRDKPWMIHLVAVTCLSLAAKVEETQVPLLLDLQVEETKYVFEAKTIQRMELLVLSTLKWKMHPVTPLSFFDHIIRRLGLKTHLHWEFLRRCQRVLLCVISDSRFVHYLPSVLATATMMHVIDQVEPFNPIDYQNQLLSVLKISKEKVIDCYKLILDLSTRPQNNACSNRLHPHKRKLETVPSSPNGVINAAFSSDSSNDSWTVGSSSVSVSSSPEPPFKKSRAHEQGMHLPSLNQVFVEIVGSPS
ncbi:cyclin-D3-1-like isoform X1 [Durio zibethinus]|uniref:Cyclin-D3-1-like isoform X1 n=1 Tax=Durio zibethinus TaxID=66656 RepID=A0A6P6ABX2_DURZI|nr:cyclin-D3-1-like isoform X1 [Durio zibethinus]